jgi:putative transposase
MPRLARLDAPGVLHHVMIRGIERRKIFRNNKDRDDLIERLCNLVAQTETACYAWSLMPNHAHFIFRTGPTPLPTFMRRLLTGYVVSFNLRHKRHGQLFQNRYKSIVCQEDAYLRELVRYIHLNPIRGRVVAGIDKLNKYPYCGHSALIGEKNMPWQDTDYVLGFFGKTVKSARKAYISYVVAGLEQGRRDKLTGGGLIRSLGGWKEVKSLGLRGQAHRMSDERILGDSDFVESVLSSANEQYEHQYELKRRGYDINRIAERVADIYGIEKEEVLLKGRQQWKVKARSLLCFWAVREVGMSLRELAVKLGMSAPGVGFCVERGEAIARGNGYELIS